MKEIPPIDASNTIRVIEAFIKTRVSEAGAKGVIIGLSGGIDSSVVASIAINALGSNNIHALYLPSNTTSDTDRMDVELLCSHLQLNFTEIHIQSIIDSFSSAFQESVVSSSLKWANLVPRIRQSILYFFASQLNYLVCGTGNKSELMIGYFTKFGDGACDILPIGDVYKTHVFQLGLLSNIPDKIMKKSPSAGLWEGQTDEAEIGMSYSQLDCILFSFERFHSDNEIAEYLRIPLEEVKMVRSKLYRSEHKRRTPLIPKLGIRTPSNDWRIPLVEPSDF